MRYKLLDNMTDDRLQSLEKEIEIIKARNVRVEADEAWEISGFRIGLIVAITFIIASLVLYLVGVKNFLMSALVPTAGYFLSTQSLPFVKRWWIEKRLSRNKGGQMD